MKKALVAWGFFSLAASTFAQGSTEGSLNFKTLGIQKLDGSGNYNVPIYQYDGIFGGGGGTVGVGTLTGGEWTFTTKPLGGDPGNGGLVITPPTLTGWGPENGAGYELMIPEPPATAFIVLGVGGLALARRRK